MCVAQKLVWQWRHSQYATHLFANCYFYELFSSKLDQPTHHSVNQNGAYIVNQIKYAIYRKKFEVERNALCKNVSILVAFDT